MSMTEDAPFDTVNAECRDSAEKYHNTKCQFCLEERNGCWTCKWEVYGHHRDHCTFEHELQCFLIHEKYGLGITERYIIDNVLKQKNEEEIMASITKAHAIKLLGELQHGLDMPSMINEHAALQMAINALKEKLEAQADTGN